MNPSRGGKARPGRPRKTTPGSAVPVAQAADFMENVTPAQSPNHVNDRTPQTVPQDRKVAGPRKQSYASRLTPGGPKLIAEEREKDRQRKDTWGSSFSEGEDFEDANREANRKGGHSLRKRARVDYSSEYIDDELGARSKVQTAPAPRGRKRKPGADDDLDHETGHVHRRRATENWRSDPSPRRKYPARRSIGPGSYAELADEKDALDTIEVGGRVQFDDSPEQTEEQEYRDATPPSPSPKKEPKKEPERFLIGIPIPASLMTGDMRLPGFTKSPDIFEASTHAVPAPEEPASPKQVAVTGAEAGQRDASIPTHIGSEGTKADTSSDQVASARAEATPVVRKQEEAAPVQATPVEAAPKEVTPMEAAPKVAAPAVPDHAEAVLKDEAPAMADQLEATLTKAAPTEPAPTEPAPAEADVSTHLIGSVKIDTHPESPFRDEVELQKEESPANEGPHLHTRRNSAPGIPSPAPISSRSTDAADLSGRRWKEFEDLKPTTGPAPMITLQEMEPALDTKTAEPDVGIEAVETVEAVGTPGPASEPTFEPEAIPKPDISEVIPESEPVAIPESEPMAICAPEPVAIPESDTEALPKHVPEPIIEPEPMQMSEPEAISEPVPEPSQSLEVDAPADARETSASESFQEATEARESSASESFQEATEATDATELEPPVNVTPSVEDQLPKGSKVHIVAIETTDKTIEPFVETKAPTPAKPWSHLTPHVAGQWTMQPESRLPQAGQARDSFTSKGSATPSSKAAETNGEPAANGDHGDVPQEADEDGDEPIDSVAVSPHANTPTMGSPVPELNHATAANSPAADEDDEAADELEEASEEPPQTQRFYKYPRLRDPDEFSDVIQHFKDMPTEDLYDMCGFVDETLVALQKEYLMLGAIVDDFENVERRKAHDEAYEQLEKRGAKVSRKTFVLKGYRAPMTEEEKDTAYQRHQDRVQAAAYGFRYDSHQSKVGKQDPGLQRLLGGSDDGEPRRTLRSDPSRSAKATEAADEVPAVPGKRVRRPRELFDPVATSRGSTPVPPRRKRGGRATSADGEDGSTNGPEQNGHLVNGVSHPLASAFAQPEKPKRGRKRETELTGNEIDEGAMLPPPPPKRIRRASTKAQLAAEEGHVVGHEPQTIFPATPLAPVAPVTSVETVVESVESPPRKRIVTLKTKAKSFRALSRALAAAAPAESGVQEERPTTSSSTNSSGTGDWSAYRQKRRRKTRDYEDEEGDYEEGGLGVHKAKRARKVTKKAEESVADNTLQLPSIHDGVVPEYQHQHQHQHQGNSGVQAPLPKGRIRLVKPGGGVSSGASGANAAVAPAPSPTSANGVMMVEDAAKKKARKAALKAKQLEEAQGELSAQEYAALSKSEKMSHSMKSRWASGSMQQAVDKRKATLAKKKAAKAAGPPGADGSPEANSEEGREVEVEVEVGAEGVEAAI